MKGLINSVRFTIVMTDLFTMMGHTQANREVNDGTYRSFNLSPFPISLLCLLPQQTTIRLENHFSKQFGIALIESVFLPNFDQFPFYIYLSIFLINLWKQGSYDFFQPERRKRYFSKFRAKFNSGKSLVAWIDKNWTDSL